MRECLFSYPTIFHSPLAVSTHLFAVIGNGMEWVDGELVSAYSDRSCKSMRYRDLWTGIFWQHTWKENIQLIFKEIHIWGRCHQPWKWESYLWERQYRRRYALRRRAERMQRQFTEREIATILEGKCTESYFGHTEKGYYTQNVCEYARALNFPDDIKKDWGKALLDYIQWWQSALRGLYNISDKDGDENTPKAYTEGQATLLAAKTRLWPLIHNGVTLEQHHEKFRKIFGDIWNKAA